MEGNYVSYQLSINGLLEAKSSREANQSINKSSLIELKSSGLSSGTHEFLLPLLRCLFFSSAIVSGSCSFRLRSCFSHHSIQRNRRIKDISSSSMLSLFVFANEIIFLNCHFSVSFFLFSSCLGKNINCGGIIKISAE